MTTTTNTTLADSRCVGTCGRLYVHTAGENMVGTCPSCGDSIEPVYEAERMNTLHDIIGLHAEIDEAIAHTERMDEAEHEAENYAEAIMSGVTNGYSAADSAQSYRDDQRATVETCAYYDCDRPQGAGPTGLCDPCAAEQFRHATV